MKSKILLIFFVFAILFRTDLSFDQDLGRHIKLGEIILKTHNIPKTNLFSYTNPDFPFINTHWLFEVISYIFQSSIGIQVFLILKVIIFLASVWLILKIVPNSFSVLLLPIGFIFLHVLRERLELRPEIFSFLFTSLTLFILEKFLKNKTKLIYLLPVVQLIWINTHIYFFVGLILQTIFLIHLGYLYFKKKLSIEKIRILFFIILSSSILSLINPNGLQGLLYPLNVNNNYGYTIVENQTIFLLEKIGFTDFNFWFVKVSIIILVLSQIIAFITKRFEIKNLLLVSTGLGLTLLNVRSFPYLFFISFPAVLYNFSPIYTNKVLLKLRFLIYFILGLILIIESVYYLNGNYYEKKDMPNKPILKFEESAKNAMDFVLKNDLPTPIFNNFDIGSYISYRGYPKYKVFVDGRPEAYPKDFFLNTYIPMQYEFSKFKEEEKKWGFKTIIFSHSDQTPWAKNFIKNIVNDKDWTLIYLDDFMMVLIKKEEALLKNIDTVDLNKISVSEFKFNDSISYLRLINFLAAGEHTLTIRGFVQKAFDLNSKSPSANYLINILH